MSVESVFANSRTKWCRTHGYQMQTEPAIRHPLQRNSYAVTTLSQLKSVASRRKCSSALHCGQITLSSRYGLSGPRNLLRPAKNRCLVCVALATAPSLNKRWHLGQDEAATCFLHAVRRDPNTLRRISS